MNAPSLRSCKDTNFLSTEPFEKKSCRGICERRTEIQNTRKIILVTFLIFLSLSVNLRVKARSEKNYTLSPQTTKQLELGSSIHTKHWQSGAVILLE